MIDHTAVNVTDLEAAKSFYSTALEPLGYSLAFEAGEFMGFADANGMDLGVVRRDPAGARTSRSSAPIMRASKPSTRRRSPRAEGTTGRRGSGRTTTSTTTARSSTTPIDRAS
jgi:catechol 2,3-dioxygenase-like lactoylglutathione lyase family enzyme